MKILLINPMVHSTLSPGSFPLGLGYIGAVLKGQGHIVEALDIRVNKYTDKDVDEFVKARIESFDAVCIGGMITVYFEIKKIVSIIKQYRPEVPVIIGGTAVSSLPDLLLRNTDADFACIGEGEITIIEIMDVIKGERDIKAVSGIGYKYRNEIVFNPPRELIQNLDSIPFPLWEIFPMDKYINAQLIVPRASGRGINLISGRGCPFRCTYCYRNFGNSVRLRSVDNIIEEMKILYEKYGITHFEFQDELFTVKKERVWEFCNKIIEEKLDISWRCLGRADLVDFDTLVLLKKAGCHWIGYGMESGSQKMLDIMQKKLRVDQIKNAIRISRAAGLEVTGTFMIGLPGESAETIQETVKFCKEMKIYNEIFFTVPYPGTQLFETLKACGHITDDEEFIKKISGDLTQLHINMTSFSDENLIKMKFDAEQEIIEYLSSKTQKILTNDDNISPDCQQYNFTQWDDLLVNQKILSDLSTIVKLIRSYVPDTADIILSGGFGRGEGSVCSDNSTIQPINDYDIVITSDNPIDRELLNSLSSIIAKKIGIRLIDLINLPLPMIKSLPYTMFNYDLKNGGLVIFGNPEILNQIPEMDPTRMPLNEGRILLFNRLICLVECFNYAFFSRPPTNEEKFFLVNQCNKAILACCDALLILQGKYHHKYVKKNTRFQDLRSVDQKLKSMVNFASNFKLFPHCDKIDFDVIDYWFSVKTIYLDIFLVFMNNSFVVRKNFSDLMDFGKFYAGFSLNDQKSRLELAEIFILSSINRQSIDILFLQYAGECLKSIKGQKLKEQLDWEEYRKECTRLWFKINH